MTNQTGPFDNKRRKLLKKYNNMHLNSLNIKCHFQKIRSLETHLETVYHSNADTPKVFEVDKRYCAFWKWQN